MWGALLATTVLLSMIHLDSGRYYTRKIHGFIFHDPHEIRHGGRSRLRELERSDLAALKESLLEMLPQAILKGRSRKIRKTLKLNRRRITNLSRMFRQSL
ncbi:hypothetical protein QR680_016155 [Steinernema hermaphroditum]|uniref:Uncharacterized protein n=1 Tax=Steinernema hermaphroditum TaxID=289476 RepID=A0AA39HAH8_9BILA|nr:hypothetical protein QR680_016155 [Steinernema hermaphroditum]